MIFCCCCDMICLSPSLSIFKEGLSPIPNLRSVAATCPTILVLASSLIFRCCANQTLAAASDHFSVFKFGDRSPLLGDHNLYIKLLMLTECFVIYKIVLRYQSESDQVNR